MTEHAEKDFSNPEYYINRELGWVAFNERVLEEALDTHQPLLERVKFLCIFSSNLDEFFEIRVGGIKQQIENNTSDTGPDGMGASVIFREIQKKVHELVATQYRVWNDDIKPALEKHGIDILNADELTASDKVWGKKFFQAEIFPILTPLAVDSSHPFPQLMNKSHNLIVVLRNSDGIRYAIVQIPRMLTALILLPEEDGKEISRYVFLSSLIKQYVGELFPSSEVVGAHAFRITRNSDLYIDDEEEENLLRTIENELRKRNRGNAVRLEVQSSCPKEIEQFLMDTFKLKEADCYRYHGPLNLQHLSSICFSDHFPHLKDRPFLPTYGKMLTPQSDIFDVMRKEDIFLHHPYETFDGVIDFLNRAASDPQVLAIKMTLYRTSGDSPIVAALIAAARNNKQVTVLVELKARFDEENNINWAKQMEEAGVHVVYGVVGLKVHCKMTMVVRRDESSLRHYVHLGTGNYHPKTARIYTDMSLLTCRAELTREVAVLFNVLTGLADYPKFKKLIVAPFEMSDRFAAMIEREIQHAKAGKLGRIVVKVNSLVDESMITALYQASCAGVKVDLIIRGICCLRPGVPGVSENIRVVSIVGRFLEHSRIYYFGNDGKPDIYLGSADWMPRNFYRRVEVVFPIEDSKIKAYIEKEVIPTYLADCVKSRELRPDGTYIRLKSSDSKPAVQAQLTFREMARKQIASMSASHSKQKTRRLIPVSKAPVK